VTQFDQLKLGSQLCHPIYSAANALNRVYKPILEKLDLTYPQYLILLVLWEEDGINLHAISERTFFDSGTMTPLIGKLKKKGLIQIQADSDDRRNKIVSLTAKGQKLKHAAAEVPHKMSCFMPFSKEEAKNLVKLVRSLHQAILQGEENRK
jgi:MarR family transcriptional regulator, organic hydroperoxide resistance regulator